MDQQSESLDPYDLLEIPHEFRPPTHYQLLGIDDFETDLELIAQAAKQRSAYLHQIAAGPHRKAVQQLMGEIAVARRTLLNEQSKAAYDAQLLADSEEYAQQQAAGATQAGAPAGSPTETTAESAEDAEASRKRRRRKSTWDEYKLHAASATILLTIVGIVWLVNRGRGERRAAEAGGAKSAPTVAAARDNVRRKSATPPRASSAARSSTPRSRPQAPKRTGPSLAPTFNVDQFLPGNTPEMSKPPADNSSAPTPPADATYAVKLDLPSDWQPKIEVVDDFTKPLDGRYQINKKNAAVELQDQRLVIRQTGASRFIALRHKKLKLKPGEAIAINTNLTAGLAQPAQVGIQVGQIRISLFSGEEHVQVRAKLANPKDAPTNTLGPLTGGSPLTTLVVIRSKDQPKQLHWIARCGEQNLSGKLTVKSLKSQPQSIAIVTSAPQQPLDEPIWIDDLRVGKFANVPDWKPSDPLAL